MGLHASVTGLAVFPVFMNPSTLCEEWQPLKLIQHYHLPDTTLENWWETTLLLWPHNFELRRKINHKFPVCQKKKKAPKGKVQKYVKLPSLCCSTNQFLPQPKVLLNFRCSQHLLGGSVEEKKKGYQSGYEWLLKEKHTLPKMVFLPSLLINITQNDFFINNLLSGKLSLFRLP